MQKIISWIIRGTLFALPLFFLPFTTEFYDFNKQILFTICIVAILLLYLFDYIHSKQIIIIQSILSLPILLFCLAAVITFFVNSPNKFESLLFPNGTGTIVLLTIWFFLIVNSIDLHKVYTYLNSLLASSIVLSIIALLQYFHLGFNLIFDKNKWIANQFWNPTGSPLNLALFIAALLPYPIIRLIQYTQKASHETDSSVRSKRPFVFGGAVGLLTFTLVVLSIALFTAARPLLLPFPFGWTIMAEVMKDMRTAALGVGLLNYLPAFTTGHTAAYNALPLWNVRFGVSTNYFLQLITELGIIGGICYVVISLRVIKRTLNYLRAVTKKSVNYNPHFIATALSIVIILISQLIFPANLLQLIILFTLLGIFARYNASKTYTENSSILYYLILVSSVISLFIISITIFRTYAAEFYLKLALDSAQQNKTEQLYRYQQKALENNPFVDKYHASFAQTNLALAVSLAQKKDLNDTQKQQIAALLAQSVRAGKNAIAMSPTNVQNWEMLGNIYRSMIGAVKDSDVWTVQAYQQAARLDPFNPTIPLAIGGVYYSAKNYDMAIQYFAQSIALKRNYPNAYYNLAAAYREKKDWAHAADAITAAISLLPSNSEDRKKAELELDQIKKNIPATEATSSGEIQNAGQNTQRINTSVAVPENIAPTDVIKETPKPSKSPNK